jgi:hypothetical protein
MLQEFFGEYYEIIGGVSIGTIALVFWRILAFFKKDKYLLPFVNIAKTKLNEIFGAVNVTAFMKIAKVLKVSEVESAVKDYADRFANLETLLQVLLQNQIILGVYDDNPELKEIVEKLL